MAYGVDAQIRVEHRLLTANQEGEDDGGDWLSSAAAQRMSLALPEFAHTREVISKFGGVIRQGTPVCIPPQKWNDPGTITHYPQRNPFDSDSFRARQQPSHVIVDAGIPGYSGHQPHAAQWSMPHRRADRRSPFLQPYLESMGESTEMYPAIKPHVPDHARLELPRGRAGLAATNRMPSVGYMGHLQGTTGNCTQMFGTSKWRNEPPMTRADAALHAFREAQERGAASMADGQMSLADEVRAPSEMFEC